MSRQVRPFQLSTSSPASSWEQIAWLVAGGFCLLGFCLAVLMMYVAWDHNPQGEFHDETGIHWLVWLGIGFGWIVAIAGVPCLMASVVSFISILCRRR